MANKVVVTNKAALQGKYGPEFDPEQLVRELVDADERRGLATRIVAIDDAREMAELGGEPIMDPTSGEQAKRAVDAIHASLIPEYLVLLGSADVIPHLALDNPVFGAPDDEDPDPVVPSDLPYASEAPASRSIVDFRAPTRVVGRLPDVTGATRPDGLSALLSTAATWRSRPRSDYEPYLGITADVWRGSTELSLKNTFGSDAELRRSPDDGPPWPQDIVGRRTHFINCHGAPASSQFLGQRESLYPVAHDAALLGGSIAEGTVTAAECCYGAELYDPAAANDNVSICMTYLLSGAYGFLGSTTASFGPANENGCADLMCQYFVRRVLAGASLGRAALEARQEFIRTTTILDPMDQKTLAQFVLLGDPSIHPVQPMRAAVPVSELLGDTTAPPDIKLAIGRRERRRNLAAKGVALGEATSYAVRAEDPPPQEVRKEFAKLGKAFGVSLGRVRSYAVERPLSAAPLPGGSTSVYLAMTAEQPEDAPMRQYRALVSVTENGTVTAVKDVRSR